MDIERNKAITQRVNEQLARGIWPIEYPSAVGVYDCPDPDENEEFGRISENLFILAGQPIAIIPDADGRTTFTYHINGMIITRTVQGDSPEDPLFRMQIFDYTNYD